LQSCDEPTPEDEAGVTEFVLRESRRGRCGSAKYMVICLRALLRFLQLDGGDDRALAGLGPSVASWRLAWLVKALDARSDARVLATGDRRTRPERRDCAIVTLPVAARGARW
jgi:hypothetical protein